MKVLCVALAALSLGLGVNMESAASARVGPSGPCLGYAVPKSTPVVIRRRHMRRLIKCAFRHYGEAGQVTEALYVANRESNLWPWAYNSASGASGLYQHLRRYWVSRVKANIPFWWFPRAWPNVSPFSARANALVTAHMVKRGGWYPWRLTR